MTTANDLRQMNSEELSRMLGEQREALFNLRLKLRTGHLENTASLGAARKDIARLETLLREQQLGIAHPIKTAQVARGKPAGEADSKTKPAKGKVAKAAKAPKASRAQKKDG